jgi:hypothetical protein
MVASAVRRLAVLLVALALAAASCGGDPPAPPPFTPSTVASSPTPTGPVEPVLPEAARQPTEEGAKAFAVFYWDLATYAQATGDTRGIRKLGAQTCAPCSGGADGVDKIYAHGGVIRGGRYEAEATGAREVSTAQTVAFVVRLHVHTDRQRIDYPGTKRDEVSAEASNRLAMIMNFIDGSWTMVSWELT